MQTLSPWFDSTASVQRYSTLSGEVAADVVVVGGGIGGLLTAWRLTLVGKKVVLLEKNRLAQGDTGATTGFLTRVPDTSFLKLSEEYGIKLVREIFQAMGSAQQELFAIIEEERLDCQFERCDSYFGSYQPDPLVPAEWEIIHQAERQASRVSSVAPFSQSIKFGAEGKMNPRQFLLALAERLESRGARLYEDSEALAFESNHNKITVKTAGGLVRAGALVVATGTPPAWLPELAPLLEPKVTYVLAARFDKLPLNQNLFWDTFNPYFYFRPIDEHTVIVGGADIAFDAVHTQNPYAKLADFIRTRWGSAFAITHQWSGTILHTSDGLPYAFAHPHEPNVYVATGWGGNGLVGSMLGATAITSLITKTKSLAAELLSLARTRATIKKIEHAPGALASGKKTWVKVGAVQDFATTQMRCALAGGVKIAVFKSGGEFTAINNTCTHAGGSLCDGTFDGQVVECPLHGARFDVKSGAVARPPATRAITAYPVRVTGDVIEAEVPLGAPASAPPGKRRTYWKWLLAYLPIPILFWLGHFLYQYYRLIPGELSGSLVRSFALTGATLIGCALFSSSIFKWFPRLAQYWRLRRYLGVSGTTFITLHALSVYHFLFDWQIKFAYYSFNPLKNPIIFGSVALPLFLTMALTSTDWAVEKLTPKKWKNLHRVAYVAYAAAILHFVFINPSLLKNPAGYLLLFVTALAVGGELFWFFKIAGSRRFKTWGAVYGLTVIILFGTLLYSGFKLKFGTPATPAATEEPLEVSVEKMKEFMKEFPMDPELATNPIKTEQAFGGQTLKRGTFQNLNYMSTGGVALVRQGPNIFVMFGDDFSTPNGPDLQVYLTKNTGPTTRPDIFGGVPLGKLKSTTGKQIYQLPEDLEISNFNSVTIHCRAFNVPWSYAPLQ